MNKLSGGHIVVEVLKKEGVEKAFCVPGESYLGVIDGLYEHPDIDLISTRHEGGASFMAEAYAKASGKVGVCMATRGPGAANLSIGLHTAMQDSTPLIALIGQVERPFKGKEAFQEVDFAAYFSHLCKWAVEIDSVERIPEILHRAFYIARSGRPGPVVVSLPHDMLEDEMEYMESTVIQYDPPEASEESVRKVLGMLREAKKPMVIAGGGVIASGAEQELAGFAELVKIPVVAAFRRFNVMPNNHPHYAGWLGFGPDQKLLETIKEADLVLTLGTRLSQVTTQDYTLFSDQTDLIQVDISPDSIGKAYPAKFAVVSDAKKFLQKALAAADPVTEEHRELFVKKCHESYLASSTPPVKADSCHYAEMNSVLADLACSVPDNSILTSDAGNFYSWLAKYFRFTDKKRYIGPTSGAMGYGLPAAIGAKAACPDHTVISFSGDGGFMMTMIELETAVRANLPVIAIVVNNNMYGTIRAHQEKHFPGRVMATSLTNPNFAEVARLFGCEGETVEKNEDFLPAFKRALKSEKPFVIEVRTDPQILSAAQAEK